jgi:hypothetical protein
MMTVHSALPIYVVSTDKADVFYDESVDKGLFKVGSCPSPNVYKVVDFHSSLDMGPIAFKLAHGRGPRLPAFLRWGSTFTINSEGILRKIPKLKHLPSNLSQSECQWYHLKACLKSFTMSMNVEG